MEEWRFQEKIIKFIKTWPNMVLVFIGSGMLAGLLVLFISLQFKRRQQNFILG